MNISNNYTNVVDNLLILFSIPSHRLANPNPRRNRPTRSPVIIAVLRNRSSKRRPHTDSLHPGRRPATKPALWATQRRRPTLRQSSTKLTTSKQNMHDVRPQWTDGGAVVVVVDAASQTRNTRASASQPQSAINPSRSALMSRPYT